jgi:uncharacterized repeat protein (TIGR01451 family)
MFTVSALRQVRALVCAFVALLSVGLAAPAVAGAVPYVLYGASGGQGDNEDTTSSDLFVIDPATGATTPVGPIGQSLTGIAYNPQTGILYGVTTGRSACERCLVTVNPTTGAATVVGPLLRDGEEGELDTVAELAFREDGTLFGWSENGDDLITIDLATGATTVVGPSGLGTYGDAMDFTGAGTLYVFPDGDTGEYYTVDDETGQATSAGDVTGAPETPECETGAALSGGTIDPASGIFYSSRIDFCGDRPYGADLLRIDLETGAATRVGGLPPQMSAIEFVPQPDLAVAKSGPASVAPGEAVTYSVTVRNNGPGTSFGPSLTDTLPAGTTFVSATQTGGPTFTCTTPAPGQGGAVTCSNDRLADGASATFNITVNTAGASGTIRNTATVSSSSSDGDTSNNTATADTTITAPAASADLAVTKAGAPARVRVLDVVRYTVTATNNGPSAAGSVVLTDALPSGTTFVSATQESGPEFTCTRPATGRRGTVRCTIASLPAGASARFTIALRVGAGAVRRSTLSNTVEVVSTATGDANAANNRATVTSRTLAARLSVTKRAARATVRAGATDRFTIRVRVSRTAAQRLRVCDRLPDGMVFVSAPGARISGRTACWSVRTLRAGASRTFTVTARAELGARGRLTNRATARATGARAAAGRATVRVLPFQRVRSGGVTG